MTELRLYDRNAKQVDDVFNVTETETVLSDGRQRRDVRDKFGKLRASVIRDAPVKPPDPLPPPPPPPATLDLGPLPTTPPTMDAFTWAQTGAPVPTAGRWGPWEDCQQWVGPDYGNTDTDVAKIKLVSSPVFPGKTAIDFWVGRAGGKSGQRAELGDWGDIAAGASDVISEVYFVPTGQTWAASHCDLMQFGHPGNYAPTFILTIKNGGGWDKGLYLTKNGGAVAKIDNFEGVPLPIWVKVKWSRGSDGRFTFGLGKDTLYDQPGANLTTDTASMKEGQYGDSVDNHIQGHGMRRWRV